MFAVTGVLMIMCSLLGMLMKVGSRWIWACFTICGIVAAFIGTALAAPYVDAMKTFVVVGACASLFGLAINFFVIGRRNRRVEVSHR